jgi:transposase InsO family protein
MSKYPYAVPIKSKTASEFSERLWEYITLFGPAKSILSDQGTEFNNKIVSQLLNGVGTERRVKSAYHPRTNGQTERFNHTLVEALRKHAEENSELWPKWIPYVLLSFRTRIHTTTKFSPYELMLAIKRIYVERAIQKCDFARVTLVHFGRNTIPYLA